MTVKTAYNKILLDINFEATKDTEKQINYLIDVAGKDISIAHSWSKQHKNLPINNTDSAVNIPDDLLKILSIIDNNNKKSIQIVSNNKTWQYIVNNPSDNSIYAHICDNKLKFSSSLKDEGANVKYQTKEYLDNIDSENINFLFPEHLVVKYVVFRFLKQKNLPYDVEMQIYNDSLAKEIQNDMGI